MKYKNKYLKFMIFVVSIVSVIGMTFSLAFSFDKDNKGDIAAIPSGASIFDGFNSTILDIKNQITEVYFIKDTESNLNSRYNAATVKYTKNNVKIWLEGAKLYVGAVDTIYLTGSHYFYQWTNLKSVEFSNIDSSNYIYMTNMFDGCSSLTSLDLSNFDTRNVTTMFRMFADCSSLTSLDLSNFDTGNVTSMGSMFDAY